MNKNILIENVKSIDTTWNETVLDNAHIWITNNKISAVSTESFNVQTKKQADKIIEGNGNYLLPGFINTHTHAAMTLLRSYADDLPLMDWLENKIWPAEAKLSEEEIRWGTLLAIVEMIKSGTTTFADMYFFMDEVAKAVDESGIRASLSRGMIGLKGEESLDEAQAFIRQWNNQGNGRITCMVGPHAVYTCPPDFIRKTLELSEQLQVPIHIHVSETAKELHDSYKDFGKSPIAHLNDLGVFQRPTLAAHCVHIDKADIAILAQKNVAVSHNIGSNLKLGSGIAPVDQLLNENVTVSLGTDGASSNNNLDLLEEARLSSIIQKGLHHDPTLIPAKEALKMATWQGAKSLFIEHEVGQIAPGYMADLILIDKEQADMLPWHDPISNIIYSCSSRNVKTVMVNGEIIMEDQELKTIDEEKVYAQARKMAERLIH